MSDPNAPQTYGPKCGGTDPQNDAYKCQQQDNQKQLNMGGGGNEIPPGKQVAPQSSGGVEVNSPQNNTSNSANLNSASNQSTANAQYDGDVGNRNVDNSGGPSGGSRKKRTRKYRKTRRRKSQKSRRRKEYVGCNKKSRKRSSKRSSKRLSKRSSKRSRKRSGGKTKNQSGWGCMSGGKRKNRRTKKNKRVRFRI